MSKWCVSYVLAWPLKNLLVVCFFLEVGFEMSLCVAFSGGDAPTWVVKVTHSCFWVWDIRGQRWGLKLWRDQDTVMVYLRPSDSEWMSATLSCFWRSAGYPSRHQLSRWLILNVCNSHTLRGWMLLWTPAWSFDDSSSDVIWFCCSSHVYTFEPLPCLLLCHGGCLLSSS